MNRSRHAPAVTSLPQAPQDEATGRVRRYVLTMAIRMICFGLTLFVTPYGWYTWVFAIATAVLPYIAVVFANAISPTTTSGAESPTQQLSAPTPPVVVDDTAASTDRTTITIHEIRGDATTTPDRPSRQPDGHSDVPNKGGDGTA